MLGSLLTEEKGTNILWKNQIRGNFTHNRYKKDINHYYKVAFYILEYNEKRG